MQNRQNLQQKNLLIDFFNLLTYVLQTLSLFFEKTYEEIKNLFSLKENELEGEFNLATALWLACTPKSIIREKILEYERNKTLSNNELKNLKKIKNEIDLIDEYEIVDFIKERFRKNINFNSGYISVLIDKIMEQPNYMSLFDIFILVVTNKVSERFELEFNQRLKVAKFIILSSFGVTNNYCDTNNEIYNEIFKNHYKIISDLYMVDNLYENITELFSNYNFILLTCNNDIKKINILRRQVETNLNIILKKCV